MNLSESNVPLHRHPHKLWKVLKTVLVPCLKESLKTTWGFSAFLKKQIDFKKAPSRQKEFYIKLPHL